VSWALFIIFVNKFETFAVLQLRASPSSRHGNNSANLIDYSGLVHLQQKQQIIKESRYFSQMFTLS